jgi:translocation and assembly module TamA
VCALAWAALGMPQSVRAQNSAPASAPQPAADTGAADNFDADMKDLPQPPPDAALPEVKPVIPDDQFKDSVPDFTPAEQDELNTPLESIEDFERRLDAKPASDEKPASTDTDTIANSPLGDQAPAEAVPDAPLGDSELLAPLPPLQSFQVEPVEITGEDAAKPAAKVRYTFEVDGLDKADAETDADMRGLFNDVSSLKDGGGEAANISQVYARLQHDADLLDTILASEGWYDPRIDTHVGASADNAPDRLSAVLDVEPGQRFTFGTIEVKADPTVPPTLIADNFPLKVGEPIVAGRVEAAEARVALVLPQNGYAFATLGDRDVALDRDTGKGDYTLPIDVGPRVRIRNITTSGEEAFDAHHIAVISRFKQNELYDSRTLDDLNKALVATGLFATVSAKPVRTDVAVGDGTEYADIYVEQHKGPPRTIAASAGYGTGEGIKAQASWTHRNLFPPEGALTVLGTLGTQEQSLGVTFTRSNAGRRDKTFQLSAAASHTDYAAVNGYTARLATRWSYDSTPIWRKTFSYAYGAQVLVTAEDDYDPSIGDLSRRTFYIAGLDGEGTFDLTDDLLDATRGFRLKAQVEPEASVEDGFHPYVRVRLDATGYVPFGSFVLAGRISAGTIQGIARDDLAPSRRFYSGGGGSVRGFGYEELGPQV